MNWALALGESPNDSQRILWSLSKTANCELLLCRLPPQSVRWVGYRVSGPAPAGFALPWICHASRAATGPGRVPCRGTLNDATECEPDESHPDGCARRPAFR